MCWPWQAALSRRREGEDGTVVGGDGPSGSGYGLTDPYVILTAFDIYNQYISDLCKTNPDRLAALGSLFARDPEEAARQVLRVADVGLKGTEVNVAATEEPIYLKEWDPLWAAVDESGLPISFHMVGLSFRAPKRETTTSEMVVMLRVSSTMAQLSGAEFISSIILSGACERYPNMKFVLGECGIGWIPYVLFRMDDEAERWKIGEHGLKQKPSEYWHRGLLHFSDRAPHQRDGGHGRDWQHYLGLRLPPPRLCLARLPVRHRREPRAP